MTDQKKAAPAMFAGVKLPPPEKPAEKPGDKVTALKQPAPGVPAAKVAGFVGVPILAVLAFALWQVSPMVALIMGIGAVVLVLALLVAKGAARRRMSTTTKINPDGSISTTTRPQKRQSGQPRQPRGDRSIRHPFGGGSDRTPGGGRGGSQGGGGRGRGGSPFGGGGRSRGGGQPNMGRNGKPRTLAEKATGRNRPTAAQKAERRAAGPGRAPAGAGAPTGRQRGPGRQPAAGKAPSGGKAPGRSRNPFSRSNGSRPSGGKSGGGGGKSPSGSKSGGSKSPGGKSSGGSGGRSIRHPFGGGGGGKRNSGGSGPKRTKPRFNFTADDTSRAVRPRDRKKAQKDPSKQSRREWWFGPNRPAETAKGVDKGKGPEGAKPNTPAASSPTARPSWRQRLTRKPKATTPAFDQAAMDARWEARGIGKKADAPTEAKPPRPARREPVRSSTPFDEEAAYMNGGDPRTVAPTKSPKWTDEDYAASTGEYFRTGNSQSREQKTPADKKGKQMSDQGSAPIQGQDNASAAAVSSAYGTLADRLSHSAAAREAAANDARTTAGAIAGREGMEGKVSELQSVAGRLDQDSAELSQGSAWLRQKAERAKEIFFTG